MDGAGETVLIDVSEIEASAALHELLAQKLRFPDYYGRNWDAFDECFGDPDAGPQPQSVRIVGWLALARRLPRDADLLRRCIDDGLAHGVRCKVEWVG